MTKVNNFIDSRRDLRERAFQALFSLEFAKTPDWMEASYFAYTYDKAISEETEVNLPAFMLGLVRGVLEEMAELDKAISDKLKEGWSIDRLTLTDKNLLRLGLYEVLYSQETPDRVAVNEIIDITKKYADEKSAKFVNGVLSQFITDEA